MASTNYSQGAQVEHDKFGLGTVLTSNEERIVIKFEEERPATAGRETRLPRTQAQGRTGTRARTLVTLKDFI